MCSNCSGDYENPDVTYVPEEAPRFSPEQEECSHAILQRIGVNSLFRCSDCGAEIPMPAEEEFADLDVASEELF